MKEIAIITIVALQLISLGISLGEHGKPKEGKNNFWISFFSFIISMALYYYAGLFDNFNL